MWQVSVTIGKGWTNYSTSKQYSCPKMLEWTGLIMASSSKTRSKASAALLGERRDSWEWDSLKLCIKRVLVREDDIKNAYRCFHNTRHCSSNTTGRFRQMLPSSRFSLFSLLICSFGKLTLKMHNNQPKTMSHVGKYAECCNNFCVFCWKTLGPDTHIEVTFTPTTIPPKYCYRPSHGNSTSCQQQLVGARSRLLGSFTRPSSKEKQRGL